MLLRVSISTWEAHPAPLWEGNHCFKVGVLRRLQKLNVCVKVVLLTNTCADEAFPPERILF